MMQDPRLFNFVLIALNAVAALRWSCAGEWMKALYWTAACALNCAVTFGAVK